MKKDEQIRDLSNRFYKSLFFFFNKKLFFQNSERDISSLQIKLKESRKVTMREPTPPPPPSVVTQSRLTQTDTWISPPVNDTPDDANKELQTKVEALERKYQTIIEQKNTQIQQLIQEVSNKYLQTKTIYFNISFFSLIHNKKYLKIK